jgi:hypothetical protein
MLKSLCGSVALKNVLLVSTRWEITNSNFYQYYDRESQLIGTDDFWGSLIRKGAQTDRHDNTRASAMRLLKRIVAMDRVTLSIQQEMVDAQLALHDTQAGMELEHSLRDIQQHWQRTLEQQRGAGIQQVRRKIEKLVPERERLKVSMEQMHANNSFAIEKHYEQQRTGAAGQSPVRTDFHENTDLRLSRPQSVAVALQPAYDNALRVLYEHHRNASTQTSTNPKYEDAEVWLDNMAAGLECWYADIGAADSLEVLDDTTLGREIQGLLQTITENLSSTTNDISKAITLDLEQELQAQGSDPAGFKPDDRTIEAIMPVKFVTTALERLQDMVSQICQFLAAQDQPSGPLKEFKSRIDEVYNRTMQTSAE